MLIFISDLIPNSSSKANTNVEYDFVAYSESLEERAENIISTIDGVGRCKVMITIKTSSQNHYAQNSKTDSDEKSFSKDYEYAYYDADSGDSPILLKQESPVIQGVVVVCDGGDNTIVKERIINCVSSLFDVPSSNISVSKYKG